MTVTSQGKIKRMPEHEATQSASSRDNNSTDASGNPTSPIDYIDGLSAPLQLKELLIHQARNLKMLPDIAVQAIEIANDPDARIKDLVYVVAQDIKLTTNIVSLSNSTLFGCSQTISSLQQAITRVGFRQTKNMIMAASVVSMMQKMPWHEFRVRDLLTKHGFLTGMIAARLNSIFKLGMQGEEFTAGLVHDVGRSLLAVAIPVEFEKFDPLDFKASEEILEREMSCIGTTHAEVGAWFLKQNHIPEELVSVARFHHAPQDSPMYTRLIALTAVADDMANFCLQETGESQYNVAGCTSLELLEKLGVENAGGKLEEWAEVVIQSSIKELGQLNKL